MAGARVYTVLSSPTVQSGAPKKSGMSVLMIIIIVVVIGIFVVVGIVGVMAALGIYGTRRYVGEAKKAEGKMEVARLARGMASCAEADAGTLPASSPAVPATLAEVAGKKYMSSPDDWKDPAFSCASFSLMSPQYFQYQWVSTNGTEGTARAIADFDGDGSAEATFEVNVTCGSGTCTVGPTVERH
jgi:type II secretory pathway pseudopilin PulG